MSRICPVEASTRDKSAALRGTAGAVILIGATALTVAPLRNGYILRLDWVVGPRVPVGSDPIARILPSRPLDVILDALHRLFTGPALQLLVPAVVLLLAGWGALLLSGVGGWAAVSAGILYAFNPFVYERLLAGHVGLLVAYAILPFAFLTVRRQLRGPNLATSLLLALWGAVLTASDAHFVFVVATALISLAVIAVAKRSRKVLLWLLPSLGAWGLLSAYWLLTNLNVPPVLEVVSYLDVELFRTKPDARLGLIPNVLGLYGFWRPGWPLPKDGLSGWPFLLVAILIVVVLGAWRALSQGQRRPFAAVVGLSGALGFFFALGGQGPTGPIFLWLYEHFLPFRIMREPQKFLVLLALAYAFFFGIGADWLARGLRGRWARGVTALVLITLPATYTYKMFWGFDGYVKPSSYPGSWAEADRLMGEGTEKALALPWHLYLPFPWTQNRVVANPMGSYFRREVIVGDNIELGPLKTQSTNPRSKYLEFLYSQGYATREFGNLVAPLGFRYVLLAKVVDWGDYSWLYAQEDLRLVKEWNDLVLFENLRAAPQVYSSEGLVQLEDWGELIGLAGTAELTDYLIRVRNAAPGPVRDSPHSIPAGEGRALAARRDSPVRYQLKEAPRAPFVLLTEPYHPEWAFQGARAKANFGVTNAFDVGRPDARGEIEFLRWRLVRAGYLLSGATMLLMLGFLAYETPARKKFRAALTPGGDGW